MGQTSEMHIALRAEEMATMYEPTFTKKEAIQTGKDLVINMLESGTVDKLQFMANLARLKEVVNSADAEMRNHLPQEKINIWGVEFTPVNGGSIINYAEDEIYQQLKADLDARAELLKLAQSQTIIDAYGNDVPKVSTTPRKSSITIKF